MTQPGKTAKAQDRPIWYVKRRAGRARTPLRVSFCSSLPSAGSSPSLQLRLLFSTAALLDSAPLIWASLTLSRHSLGLISRAEGHQRSAARPIIRQSLAVCRETADVSASDLLFTHTVRSLRVLTITNATSKTEGYFSFLRI